MSALARRGPSSSICCKNSVWPHSFEILLWPHWPSSRFSFFSFSFRFFLHLVLKGQRLPGSVLRLPSSMVGTTTYTYTPNLLSPFLFSFPNFGLVFLQVGWARPPQPKPSGTSVLKCRSLSSPYWMKVCMVEPGNQHSQQTSQMLFFPWISFKHRTDDKPAQDDRASITANWQVQQVFWGGSNCWRENGIRGWYWSWALEDAWELQTFPKSTHFPSSRELTP